MTPSDLATALDYAEALEVARKAKAWLAGILVGMLSIEITLFFVFRYAQPSPRTLDGLHYLIGLFGFLGIVATLLLAIDLLLIVNIMLVGRLLGLAKLMWAMIWCVALLLLLFPWQAFLANATFTHTDFKLPGVLYTWDELTARAHWQASEKLTIVALLWARFVAFPLVALVATVLVQLQSSRGIRLAQGDITPPESR